MTVYLTKMILCSGLLLLAWLLLLRKEKMFGFNRFYLLLSLPFTFLIPLIVIPAPQEEVIPITDPVLIILQGEPVQPSTITTTSAMASEGGSFFPLLLVYGLITAVLLIRFFFNLSALIRNMRQYQVVPYGSARMVVLPGNTPPYSFLNRIFVGRDILDHGQVPREILLHEMAHIKKRHSLDILLIELLLCFAWFNPFFYGYRKAMRLNHEFEADALVLKDVPDVRSYQMLLLHRFSHAAGRSLTSSFHFITTKQRMIMMQKTTSPLRSGIRKLAILPIAAGLIIFLSQKLTAQDSTGRIQAPPVIASVNPVDTTKYPAWIGVPIGYTKEGISPEELMTYKTIIDKYRDAEGRLNAGKLSANITSEDRNQLETTFAKMSLKQQQEVEVIFVKQPKPMPKAIPTKAQLSSFKNEKVYGIWIDGKRVIHSELDNYAPEDFSHYFVSKLYGAAKKGRSYTHQLDLMTNAYYQQYYDQTMKHQGARMVVTRPAK